MPRCRTLALVLTAVVFLSACTEPLEFREWTIPVPDGTEVLDYRHVPDEERTDVLELERNLELSDAFGRPFYEASGLAVADDGRIFVLDGGNFRVVVFAPDGEPLGEFGREGEGPGELRTPENIALVGDRVVINDRMSSKFSVYSMSGDHLVDHHVQGRLRANAMLGVGDDLMIVRDQGPRYVPDGEMTPGQWSIGRYALTGEELARVIGVPYVWRAYWGSGPMTGSVPMRMVYVSTALGGQGRAYLTNGDEYQVLALDADGSSRFALRTSYVPEPLDEGRKREATRQTIETFSQFVPDLSESDFVWPDQHQAIDRLAVDGSGNLYVFPLFLRWIAPGRQPEGPFPVDVYSPDGERLYTGKMPIWRWDAALDDWLYSIETDPETDEQIVVRYRMNTDLPGGP